jgi:hypothetical protein
LTTKRWYRRHWGYAIAALIALVGIASRIYVWYHARPLWVDEEMVLLNVRDRTFAQLTGALWLGQSAPLGWLWLQRAVMLIFGMADRTGRAVPVLFGLATLLVAFWAGRRWLGPVGTAVFVLLFSFGQHVTFFIFEAKQYSADVCGALAVSALAIWAMEPTHDRSAPDTRRTLVWWVTAAVGQWFANGALFIVPGCALVLCGVAWQRGGWKRAAAFAVQGLVWPVSFALHYQLSIRYTLHSEYLQNYWALAFPPPSAGISGTVHWLADQFQPLALNSGGTPMWVAFWLVAGGGIAIALRTRTPEGFVLLSAPLSAFALAAFRLVPLSGRLSLWIVPALYAGIAIAADAAVRFGRGAIARRNWSGLAPAGIAAVIVLRLCSNIYQLGEADLFGQPKSKHGFDDHAAVRWLMGQRQPGDVLMATHLGLPAVWWYAGISPENPRPDILEARHEQVDAVCRSHELNTALAGAPRVAVYLGFDSGTPAGLQEMLLDSLSDLGTMTTYRGIAEEGRAAIFDLRLPPKPWAVMATTPTGNSLKTGVRPPGCVGVRTASRW